MEQHKPTPKKPDAGGGSGGEEASRLLSGEIPAFLLSS